jgi:aminobenzoyl-glutamate transport protein
MSGYLVLMFFAAQFVNYFNWTQLGSLIALKGAYAIQSLQLHSSILLTIFILSCGFINLFIGSASAKWAMLAPVFVPMLFLAGIPPEQIQMAYRIGDSTTNIITPLMPYFALVLSFAQQWDKQTGAGSLIALMLPFSISLAIGWVMLLIIWINLELPLGF